MKRLINQILSPTGYKFARIDNYEDIKFLWLKDYEISTVLDVGANEGQFAAKILQVLPDTAIHSFEPLKDTYDVLIKNLNKNGTAYNFALGDFNGQSKIYKNEYSPSSSILELGQKHLEQYPTSNKVSFEEIQVKRLDDVIHERKILLKTNIVLKMDVQGFEDKVVMGAQDTLRLVKVVLVEVSFWELYKNQALFEKIFLLLTEQGFLFRGNYDLVYNRQNGMPLFADAIFIRE